MHLPRKLNPTFLSNYVLAPMYAQFMKFSNDKAGTNGKGRSNRKEMELEPNPKAMFDFKKS